MSQTRAALDRKITQLEVRAKEFRPSELTRRYLPEYFVDRVIGGVLTLAGVGLAWGMRRRRAQRRERVRAAMGGYSRW
jgi:uncharacterized protein (TIGR03382 family)